MRRPAQTVGDPWLRRTAVAFAVVTIVLDGFALSFLARVPAGASVVLGLREAAPYVVAWMSFAVVGALIVSRHPRHRIGWLCLAIAVVVTVLALTGAYATYALAINRGDRLGLAAAWVPSTFGFPAVSIATLIVLLFPDGHLPSGRWRVVAVAAFLGAALSIPAFGLAPIDLGGFPGVRNPIALSGFAGAVAIVVGFTGGLLIAVAMVGAVASLIVRWRVARGDERRQLTWIAFAGMGVTVVLALTPVLSPDILRAQPSGLQHALAGIALAGIAIAIGIAVLRYRLYDIDVVVDRTLVYGALTAILAGLYAASIRLFQALFVAATGESSDAALVLTTLVLATSFTPIKRRLETIVERRYRRAGEHRPAGGRARRRSAEAELDTRLDAIDRSLAGLNERLAAVEGRDGETR
jgi:hypothetical protein